MNTLETIFPPDRYELIPRVAVFKTHQRHKSGKLVKVDKQELERIAKNHNNQFVKLKRASPFAKGHTLDEGPDGADVKEEDQPDVVGYGVKFFVDKHPAEPNEDYLFCDLYIMKSEKDVLEKYPAISPEYYPSLHQLYPISFLKSSAPELALPPVLHRYELEADSDEPYRLTMSNPLSYTNKNEKDHMDKNKECYEKDEKKTDMKDDEKKAVKDAEETETKGAKTDAADLATLKEQVASLMEEIEPIKELLPALQELVGLLSESEEGDEGEGDEKDALVPGQSADKAVPMKAEKEDESKTPVKFDSSATATNVSVPSYSKKEDYTVENEDLIRYKKEVQTELDRLKAENEEVKKIAGDLSKKNRRAEAEKLVYSLENQFNVVFASPTVREEEVVMLTELDDESAQIWFERAKVRYQKKTPNAETVKQVVKYSTENPDDIKALPPEESKKLADQIIAKGLTFDQYFAQLANKTK